MGKITLLILWLMFFYQFLLVTTRLYQPMATWLIASLTLRALNAGIEAMATNNVDMFIVVSSW